MAKPKPQPTHPIAWFLLRRLVALKRAATRLCPLLWLRQILTVFGILGQLPPWLVIRIVTLWIPAPGDFAPAFNRLLWGLPVYGFWCGLSTYGVRDYCRGWVAVVWLALLLLGGLLALGQTQLRQKLRVRYRLPTAATQALGATSLLVVASCAAALIYLSPIEFLRGNAPDFSQLEPAALAEQLSADEHRLDVVLAELTRLNAAPEASSSAPNSMKRSLLQDGEVALRLLSDSDSEHSLQKQILRLLIRTCEDHKVRKPLKELHSKLDYVSFRFPD